MKFVVTTLSIGKNYTKDYTCRLIKDVLEKTNNDIYITTDCDDVIENQFGKQERIKIQKIKKEDIKLRIKIGNYSDDFNFNMRYLCLKPVKDLEDAIVIFTDCDNSFDWWDDAVVTRFIEEKGKDGYDFYGPRMSYIWRNFLDDYKSQNKKEYGIFWHKILNYRLDVNSNEWDNAPLPAEYLLIFDNRGKKLNKFYDQWKWFHDHLVNMESSFGTWAEGFEIGVSSYIAGFKGYDIGWNHDIWSRIFCANGYKTGPRGGIVHQTERG